MSTDHLFVYGTLRRSADHPKHGLILPATFIGPGRFPGRLYDLGSYPGVVASDDPADRVHGEVYRLHDPAATLARLDVYEGCGAANPPPTEYARSEETVRSSDGEAIRAYVYLYRWPLGGARRIVSGDYLNR